jgi:hypothetical protein
VILDLITKAFNNQTEIFRELVWINKPFKPLIIKDFEGKPNQHVWLCGKFIETPIDSGIVLSIDKN